MKKWPQGYFCANSLTHLDSFSLSFLPLGYSDVFFKYVKISNIFFVIVLSCAPTNFIFFWYLLCLVVLCKGRVSLELLSRSNNLETQMISWTLTSSRVAGDSDFTEGEGLSWTWTDQNSSFTTIPIILNFHGSLLQYIWFVPVPCGTGRREAGIRKHERWGGYSHLQDKLHFCQAPAPTVGQWHLCHLPLSQRMAAYKPTQNTWQHSDPVFNFWQRKKSRDTAFTFPTWEGGNPVSVSLCQENTFLNPGNDRLHNVDSAHFAIYLDLHISIMVLLLSGKDSDCPDQSIHKGEENFLLAL